MNQLQIDVRLFVDPSRSPAAQILRRLADQIEAGKELSTVIRDADNEPVGSVLLTMVSGRERAA